MITKGYYIEKNANQEKNVLPLKRHLLVNVQIKLYIVRYEGKC